MVPHRPFFIGTGLSAVESLNLTFLVDTQHQGLVGGIEVKADYIIELLDEVLTLKVLVR